ncbi:hypothetical protein OJF2_09700 [Aquisphaera giovannonii]|uniref:Uncharacterized protein n=1 Tax=Aquisphaera giovannonii TaxID=406548 RepID=A0A5B9VVW6_9BACT|nr:hypothetical protein [Aquisphaera giovannonii]QEH32493.1 hypothetical protein OJF2_09700 [Aquisphaera giovannonii]
MKRRSATPWKKSRTYGDIHGGRARPRLADNVFALVHSLRPPAPGRSTPILVQDNPSSAFSFPVAIEELAAALSRLPAGHAEGLTHIWLRRRPGRGRALLPLAEFVRGSGVSAIVLYPWPRDGKLDLGRDRLPSRTTAAYLRFGGQVAREHGRWHVRFAAESDLRRFVVEHLFCHELGHHVDWYRRRWSKANVRRVEEYADQFAARWGPLAATALSER